MRFTTVIAFFAGVVAAQTTTAVTPQSTECPAQNIVEACLSTTQTRLASCAPNDWSCMCTAQQAVLTCYNNCPQDPRVSSANNQQIQWCNAASVAGTTTTAVSRAVSLSTSAATTSSGTSSATGASKTGAAGAIVAPGSGILAMAIGVAGLL